MSSTFAIQWRSLVRRSVVRTLRDPGSVIPPIVIPLVLFAVVAAGLQAATEVPGFPTDSFTTFALTIAFAQGAALTVATTGQSVATDIDSGFMNRLSLTPMRGAALLTAQLAGPLVLGVAQAIVFFGIGIAVGAEVAAGVGGALVLTGLFLVAVLGFGALGMFVGLQTGSAQAVQAIAPLMSVFLFLSSLTFPRNLIESDWFRAVATGNPLSYFVEGMRSLLIEGWNTEALALGFAVAGGLLVVSLAAAATALRTRLVRT